MRWWMWLILIPVGFFVVMGLALASFRRRVRLQFVDFLREVYPQFEVVGQSMLKLDVKTPEGATGEMYLRGLYAAIAEAKAGVEPLARRPVFEHFASSILSDFEEQTRELELGRDGDRVMPRLVTGEFIAALPRDHELPRRPVTDTGLFVVYVLDHPQRVTYLTRKHADELGLADAALHERALVNLRKTGSGEKSTRQAVEERSLVVVKALDTYDAVRVLLVPEHLRDGEGLVAGVPDRDTLVLVALPRDKAKELPMTPDNTDHLLLGKPLWVTKDGVELA